MTGTTKRTDLMDTLDAAIAEEVARSPATEVETTPLDVGLLTQPDTPADEDDSFGESTRMVSSRALSDMERAKIAGVRLAADRVDPLPAGRAISIKVGSSVHSFRKSLIMIGRVQSVVDLALTDDVAISRHHAAITYVDGSLYVEDLHSTNGTKIDGVRIARQKILPPCNVVVGNTQIRISFESHGGNE